MIKLVKLKNYSKLSMGINLLVSYNNNYNVEIAYNIITEWIVSYL